MVGRTLGKYRILEKIGRGGMGIVYRGLDETLDRQVAIKAINPELVDEDLVRRFRAEAVTLAKVNHPNIATVYELFRDDDRLLMVMELVRGQTFEQLADWAGPMSVERAAMLVGQILDALGHAHRAGIVHRDLKPANLMLTESGIVKVMDFGIARVAGTERMTTEGLMVGTPAYMAPEQVRGEDVDGRTDLYAVGVVFYRLLTGKLPFRADTAVAMIQAQLNTPPTPARQIRWDLPEWLDAALMRSMEKRPVDRFQTADEFRRALDAVAPVPDAVTVATPSAPASARGFGVTPASAARPPATPAAATPPAGTPGTTTLVLDRSHLVLAGGLGALLLIVTGALAWVALRNAQAPVQIVTAPAAPAAPAPSTAPPSATSSVPAPQPASPPAAPPGVTPAPNAVAAGASQQPGQQPPSATGSSPPDGSSAMPPRAAFGPRSGETLPPFPRGGRGGRGLRGGLPPRAAGAEFAPMVVRDVQALGAIPGRGNRFVDAIVAFSEQSITASDARTGLAIKTFLYGAVTHTTLSRSRKPRGAGGADVVVPGGIPEGNIFARGPRLWVTIETADDRLVLRVDPEKMRPIADLIVSRTRIPIERYMEPERP